jgi:Phosphoglycerate mutase 1
LTDNGLKEARGAGNILKNRGFVFDVALVKYLDDLPDDGVISLNIPTGLR